MARSRFSRRARADLLSIAAYTLQTGGPAQANDYIEQMEGCCRLLARNPLPGRSCDDVRVGLRRMEKGKHVIFYRQAPGGIRVVRILRQRMRPARHVMDEPDDCPGPGQE